MKPTATARPWLLTPPGSTGTLDLYCFPHAGGNPAEYARWADALPGVALHTVQLPGRGGRHREPYAGSMPELVAGFLADVPLGEGPFAFFGHSLGALVAYEITRALHTQDRPLPRRLIASAFPAPHLPRPGPPLHTLPDDAFLEAVSARHGGIPEPVLASRHLRAMITGPLRADLRLAETHYHRPGPPLPVPLTVFTGTTDPMSATAPTAWQPHTALPLTVRTFPGGHFPFRDDEPRFLRALSETLA
ncbi:thioesterase II family protein [Streptomyces sp. NPDC088729]|uniref:thioesterase II family protein n=1 Tax=Streptomyces sp. NPDC088729 TaxID=3365876 RepID=UPI0037FE6A44